VKYQIISAETTQSLETYVNNEIRHGWQVTGGLTVYMVESKEMLQPHVPMFVQAMINEGEEE